MRMSTAMELQRKTKIIEKWLISVTWLGIRRYQIIEANARQCVQRKMNGGLAMANSRKLT